jgi:hypothetical protein
VNVTLGVDTLLIQLGKEENREWKAHILTTSLVEKERDATAGHCGLMPDVCHKSVWGRRGNENWLFRSRACGEGKQTNWPVEGRKGSKRKERNERDEAEKEVI